MARVEADLVLLDRFTHRGDADAFAEIVRRYAGLVYSTCVRILQDRARAEDVSQDTFFRLMKQPQVVNRSVGAWLHRTATRRSLDVLRSESARRQRERNYAQEQTPRDQPSRWEELSPQIDDALERLPEPLRQLLVEHYLGGKSQRQLAKEMRTSPATMSRRMKQALDALRDELSRKGMALGVVPFLAVLATQAAEAAPATLMLELGKMSMVSGPTAGPAPSSSMGIGIKAAVIAVGAAAVGLAAISFTGIGQTDTHTTGQVRPEKDTVPTQAVQAVTESTPDVGVRFDGRVIRLQRPAQGVHEPEAQRVVAFQPPSQADGPTIAVHFADGHVQDMAITDAGALVEQQTGRSIEQLELSAFADR